ncbi:hypothetical protein SFUMM280S_04579 [Streptomyces fumanus]
MTRSRVRSGSRRSAVSENGAQEKPEAIPATTSPTTRTHVVWATATVTMPTPADTPAATTIGRGPRRETSAPTSSSATTYPTYDTLLIRPRTDVESPNRSRRSGRKSP